MGRCRPHLPAHLSEKPGEEPVLADPALALACTATELLQEVGIGNQVLFFNAPGDENDGKNQHYCLV